MKHRGTRKIRRYQRGGALEEADGARLQLQVKRASATPGQIVHCLSQLKRFVGCFATTPADKISVRLVQFAYNLGRLQELCGETTRHDIWWKPIEPLIAEAKWGELEAYIERLRIGLGVEYDAATLAKGC